VRSRCRLVVPGNFVTHERSIEPIYKRKMWQNNYIGFIIIYVYVILLFMFVFLGETTSDSDVIQKPCLIRYSLK